MQTQYFYTKKNTATAAERTFTFTLRDVAATSSDVFADNTTAGTPIDKAEIFIFIDGAYSATATNDATIVSAGKPLYVWVADQSEVNGNYIDVIITDGGTTYRDAHLKILTEINLGNVDIAAPTNTTALKLTGNGTGHGLECVGGATGKDISGVLGDHALHSGTCGQASSSATLYLDTGSSGTSDYYNGAIVIITGGTGAGQARVITDYSFSTYGVCTLNKALSTATDATSTFTIIPGSDPWAISPGAELSTMPTKTSNFADILQWLFERFAYKRDMSTTLFQMYNEAGDTVKFDSSGNSDTGGTQTFNKMADA